MLFTVKVYYGFHISNRYNKKEDIFFDIPFLCGSFSFLASFLTFHSTLLVCRGSSRWRSLLVFHRSHWSLWRSWFDVLYCCHDCLFLLLTIFECTTFYLFGIILPIYYAVYIGDCVSTSCAFSATTAAGSRSASMLYSQNNSNS